MIIRISADVNLDRLGDGKKIKTEELFKKLKEVLSEYIEYTPDDYDNFHTDFSYKSV